MKLYGFHKVNAADLSLPARGVWIEMGTTLPPGRLEQVTPRKGSVD